MSGDGTCSGCGLTLPARDGPVHAYVTTSPECWALFTSVLRDQPERMFTDAYMAQHPDGDDLRQLQSVAGHLVALEAVLTMGQPRAKTADVLVAAIELGRDLGGFRYLERPTSWSATIADVVAQDVTGTAYVTGVLEAWHETEGEQIASWAEETLRRLYARTPEP